MSLIHTETNEIAQREAPPAGARPLGVKVRPVLRLALGYRDDQRNGAPVKTDYFVPRAENENVVARFTGKYGDKPKSVRILLPADLNDALDIRYVAFKGASGGEGGNLVAIGQTNFALRDYMGGPDTVTVWNQDGTVDELTIDGPDDPQLSERDVTLELRTRLRFGIPDVLGFGSFAEVQTGGKESTDSLWLKVRELYAIFGSRVTMAVEPLLVLKPSTMRAPKFEGRGRNAKQVGWQKTAVYVVDVVVPESIEEMIERLRERQQVLAPNGATAAIYGPPRAALESRSLPQADEQGDDPSPSPGQSGATSPPDSGPASPSDEPTLGEEPVLEGEVVDDPGLYVVPEPYVAAGKTLAEIAESAEGATWLEWAAGSATEPEFKAALAAFAGRLA